MIGGDALVVVVDMIGNDDDCAAVFEFVEMMISLGWWWFGVVDDDDDDNGKSNNDPSESQQLCVIVDRLGIDTTGLSSSSSLASTNIDDEADQSLPLKYLLEWTPYPPSVNRVSDAIRT